MALGEYDRSNIAAGAKIPCLGMTAGTGGPRPGMADVGGPGAGAVRWRPEAWEPIVFPEVGEGTGPDPGLDPSRTRSFYDYQDPAEAYEVRGILPRADLVFRERD